MSGMKGYGQFCPVALASELFAQRWTPLILRELLHGGARFNQLHRGIPLISRGLLVQRLLLLIDAGVVERARGPVYRLTAAGTEFAPIIEGLGTWGQRWMRELHREDLSVDFLMWSIRRRIHRDRLPPGRTVVQFRFSGVVPAKSRFWLVLSRSEVDLCLEDPGFDVDLIVETGVRAMVEVWRGLSTFADVLREGRLRLEGRRELRKAFPGWLMLSKFAVVPAPARAGMR